MVGIAENATKEVVEDIIGVLLHNITLSSKLLHCDYTKCRCDISLLSMSIDFRNNISTCYMLLIGF